MCRISRRWVRGAKRKVVDMIKPFEVEVLGMGFNNSGYPGAFTPVVNNIIKTVSGGKVLHLYSGSSLIGDERVDIEHPNATINCRVEDFIKGNKKYWDWVVLDPPYNITNEGKLKGYGLTKAVFANVPLRNALKQYFQNYAGNIMWLDYCAPMIKGFDRRKLWFLLPGGFHTVRVLSWLKKATD